MPSVVLIYLTAVICSETWTHALPLYPEPNQEQQAEFFQKLVSEVEDGASVAEGDKMDMSNLYPLLMQQNGGRDLWHKANKDAAQQDKYPHMVEDLKEVVLKLAAADRLRSQGFVRSEQSLPKTNKRGDFLPHKQIITLTYSLVFFLTKHHLFRFFFLQRRFQKGTEKVK
uniref:Urotensin-related peptide 1 n=1 Tax=Oryzias latipes TaxID=8090 RepID=A0A3P9JB78_ORYLA